MRKKTDSPTVISTTLCCEEVDKDGRILRRFCVTLPGEYPTGPDTPAAGPDCAEKTPEREPPLPPAAD